MTAGSQMVCVRILNDLPNLQFILKHLCSKSYFFLNKLGEFSGWLSCFIVSSIKQVGGFSLIFCTK